MEYYYKVLTSDELRELDPQFTTYPNPASVRMNFDGTKIIVRFVDVQDPTGFMNNDEILQYIEDNFDEWNYEKS